MLRKVLATLLAVCMVLSTFVVVSAEDEIVCNISENYENGIGDTLKGTDITLTTGTAGDRDNVLIVTSSAKTGWQGLVGFAVKDTNGTQYTQQKLPKAGIMTYSFDIFVPAEGGNVGDASFYLRTQDGESASVKIAHYHTLDGQNVSEAYREVYGEDYPSLSVFELSYDGKIYTLTWEENGTPYVRTYKYLMKEERTVPTPYSSKEPQKVTYYVLKNDKDASLEELFGGMLSAKLGDAVDYFTVYREKET
jgi:hypothetical protein